MDLGRLAGLATIFSLGISIATWVGAAPGDLDATFGNAGFVRFDVVGDYDYPSSIFAQADGKLLVGRINDLDTDDFSVLRLNTDGTPDVSFDGDGRTSFDIPDGHGWTTAVLQQTDGSVVAAGVGGRDLTLVRYLSDGRPDLSFGLGGVAHHEMTATAALQQHDGKLVVAGYLTTACYGCWDYYAPGPSARPLEARHATGSGMGLVRFDSIGVVDVGFGVDGVVDLESVVDVKGLAEQPDGKLLVVGTSDPAATVMTVYRLTADGALDPTFGTGGVVTIAFVAEGGAESDSYGEAVALDGDGKIVVAGTANFQCCNWLDVTGDLAVARLNSDGGLDDTFGKGGRVLYDHGASETIDQGGLIIESSGTIIVAGHRSIVETDELMPTYGLVARFTTDGAIDTSFGRSGVALIDVGHDDSVSDATAHGIVRLPDGRLAAAFTARASTPDPAIVVAGLTLASGPGAIGFVRSAISAAEGIGASVVVRRSGGAAGPVTVEYSTSVGSLFDPGASLASAGADFTPTAGMLSWADGDASDRTIAIPTAADTVAESNETFVVRLSNPTGGAGLATSYAEVTITDQLVPSTTRSSGKSGGGGSGVLEMLLLGLLVGWARARRSRMGEDGFEDASGAIGSREGRGRAERPAVDPSKWLWRSRNQGEQSSP